MNSFLKTFHMNEIIKKPNKMKLYIIGILGRMLGIIIPLY
jgi:hypothetical protein